MSDDVTIPPAADPPPADPPPAGDEKIAGKYDTQEAFDTGYDHLAEKLGLTGVARTQFDTPEEKVAAYKTMQTTMDSAKPADPAPPPAEDSIAIPEPGELVTDDMGLSDVIAKAGINVEEVASFYRTNGRMPVEAINAVKAVMPQLTTKMIEDQAAGMAASGELQAHRNAMIKQGAEQMVGGTEQLNNLLQSAATLPNAAILNQQLKDPNQYQAAIREIQFQLNQKNGTNGEVNVQHANTNTSKATVDPFPDNRSWLAAKNDPKFNVDAAYTKQVKARYDATPVENFGISDRSRVRQG